MNHAEGRTAWRSLAGAAATLIVLIAGVLVAAPPASANWPSGGGGHDRYRVLVFGPFPAARAVTTPSC